MKKIYKLPRQRCSRCDKNILYLADCRSTAQLFYFFKNQFGSLDKLSDAVASRTLFLIVFFTEISAILPVSLNCQRSH